MLFELQSSQPRELRVIRDFRPSNFDSFKHWIENTTCSKWNWWPFDEPRYLPPRGEVILTWECGCGTTRQEHMPFQLAERLSRLCLERRHNAGPEGASSHQGLGPHSPVNSQDSTSSQSSRPIDSDDSRSSTDITESEMTSQSEATNDTHITIEGPDLKYVFIIIKTSNSKLVQVEVNDMKAVEFFRSLKAQYLRTRGFFRSWFSIYVYNHCDFVKIQKWNPERFAAHPEFSFPPCEDLEYSYRPKPMKVNPIPPEIFKDIFYSCSGSGSLTHQFHFACQPLRNIAEEIMDRLPKRDRPVIASSDAFKLEELWGLATRERRSALRVLIYLVLSTSPTVAFMFAWLFGWTKDGDLQSASTPMTITVAALTLLWTVIYSGTGGD
ncbi:hypothetical protein F5Y13DRAFT_161266 [Hypoxylon sp. FL1857]|nr:hypothetical protein F5Y13DRAFT_161266 [Hypoxylon sp. FL1857]